MKTYKTANGILKDFKTLNLRDVFKFKGVIYTLASYDMEGAEIIYGNKRTTNCIFIETKNRYKNRKDAKLIIEEDFGFYRNDINYID